MQLFGVFCNAGFQRGELTVVLERQRLAFTNGFRCLDDGPNQIISLFLFGLYAGNSLALFTFLLTKGSTKEQRGQATFCDISNVHFIGRSIQHIQSGGSGHVSTLCVNIPHVNINITKRCLTPLSKRCLTPLSRMADPNGEFRVQDSTVGGETQVYRETAGARRQLGLDLVVQRCQGVLVVYVNTSL